MDEEEKLDALRQDFFSYYRRMRSNLFSDTEIVYETRLTTEVFDLKLQQLSQDKKQSEFENFAIAVASRLITPNIKPQTGPDGGGDGKVDGETYPIIRLSVLCIYQFGKCFYSFGIVFASIIPFDFYNFAALNLILI